jgi:hypothetical protein
MTTLATTTLPALERIFTEKIRTTVPRVVYGGADKWQPYDRSTDAATTSRRFTLRWELGRHQPGGIFTNLGVETEALLRVRVDYRAGHTNNMEMAQDDWSQLRDRMHQLTADPANGLVLVLQTTTPPSIVADNDHGRRRVSDHGTASSDAVQFDLTYQIRYFQARAAAA